MLEFAGNLLSGTCHKFVSMPSWVLGKALKVLCYKTAQESCWGKLSAAAYCWLLGTGKAMCVLQELTKRNTLDPRSKTLFLLQWLPSTLCWQSVTYIMPPGISFTISFNKGKSLKGPDPFLQSKQKVINLELRGSRSEPTQWVIGNSAYLSFLIPFGDSQVILATLAILGWRTMTLSLS